MVVGGCPCVGSRARRHGRTCIVDDALILELNAVEALLPIHEARLLTYLGRSRKRVGILMNFNVELLKRGLERMVL